jgi:hypothetical protein
MRNLPLGLFILGFLETAPIKELGEGVRHYASFDVAQR